MKKGSDIACANCGKIYYVPPCRIGKSKYCCKKCADEAQTTSERREIVCRRCGAKFVTTHDHGKWPVYCSRSCFEKDAPKPVEKECPVCGVMFLATRTSHETPDGLRRFCSVKCRKEGLRKGELRTCINCGNEFYLNPSKQSQRPKNGCCSAECQKEFYVLENNPNWKGGKYIDTGSGQRRQICKRENASSDYLAEHRVIAARYIGRFLERSEPMLHLNMQPADNSPENLFICGSISEMARRLRGDLPWPEESNLSTYGKQNKK